MESAVKDVGRTRKKSLSFYIIVRITFSMYVTILLASPRYCYITSTVEYGRHMVRKLYTSAACWSSVSNSGALLLELRVDNLTFFCDDMRDVSGVRTIYNNWICFVFRWLLRCLLYILIFF